MSGVSLIVWHSRWLETVVSFLVDLDFVDEVHTIKTSTSEFVSKHPAKKYGLFVGVSAGANLYSSFDCLKNN